MTITIFIQNELSNETRQVTVTLNDEASISELLNAADCGIGDFSEYYAFSSMLSRIDASLPFLISDGQLLYDVPFNQAKVVDFVKTFGLDGKVIELDTGYPMAGGPGLVSLKQIWESAKPILEGIAIFCSIGGLSVPELIKWFCTLFQKRERTPHTCFDIIYSRTMWNHHELASLLEIEVDRTKKLLQVFGFEYDQQKGIYVQSENVEEINKKLTNIKGLDE